jgi:hypothetical protein
LQECWQLVAQWVWNLRLELGHQLHPDPVRTTEFAPALPPRAMLLLMWARPGKLAESAARTLLSSLMGRCVARLDQKLSAHEHRREADGTLRVVYGASIRSCRPCPLRKPRQWQGSTTKKPRQGSRLLHPLAVGSQPLLWKDWSRRFYRRACIQLVCDQHIEVRLGEEPPGQSRPAPLPAILSRAHSRLPWAERLARNARVPGASPVTIKLFGIPERFAASLALATA